MERAWALGVQQQLQRLAYREPNRLHQPHSAAPRSPVAVTAPSIADIRREAAASRSRAAQGDTSMKKTIACVCVGGVVTAFLASAVAQTPASPHDEFGSWSLGRISDAYRSSP